MVSTYEVVYAGLLVFVFLELYSVDVGVVVKLQSFSKQVTQNDKDEQSTVQSLSLPIHFSYLPMVLYGNAKYLETLT